MYIVSVGQTYYPRPFPGDFDSVHARRTYAENRVASLRLEKDPAHSWITLTEVKDDKAVDVVYHSGEYDRSTQDYKWTSDADDYWIQSLLGEA